MLQIRVEDPLLRATVRRRPIVFGLQFFLMMIGMYALLSAVTDAIFGDASFGAAMRLARPALVTSILATWLMWRGSRDASPPTGAA
jgi:hypothetical protein